LLGYRPGTIGPICHIEKDACVKFLKNTKLRCRDKINKKQNECNKKNDNRQHFAKIDLMKFIRNQNEIK